MNNHSTSSDPENPDPENPDPENPDEASSLTQRQKQAQARSEQILAVALELFARQGFAATSTRQIAHEAGIAEGLIFHYFPTKVDLLKAVATQRHTLAGEMNAILEGAANVSAEELARQIAVGWLQLMRRQAHLVSMLLAESMTNPELQQVFTEIFGAQRGRLAAFLRSRVEAGELREDLPVEASAMMLTSPLVLFFIAHRHLPDEAWEEQAASYVEAVLDHWLRGAVRRRE